MLPIGGVKEKLLAAYREGMKVIILPRENKKDLEEIPQNILESFNIIFAEDIKDVLSEALLPVKEK